MLSPTNKPGLVTGYTGYLFVPLISKIFERVLPKWIAAFCVLASTQCTITSIIIAYTLWRREVKAASRQGDCPGKNVPFIFSLLVDSVVIYTVAWLILTVLFAARVRAQHVVC